MMVIISKSTLNKYGEGYPESKEALLNWYLKIVK
jgi:mRNA-degrading endonuclease HigB of HigAB toxin-antitoxin module